MRYILPALLVLATGSSAFAQVAPAATPSFGLGKVFDEADVNRDNVVTKQEFLAKAERHFGMADGNKDNKITREEMQAQQAAFTQQMQQNILGSGWQGKLNQFLGQGAVPATQAAPTTPVITSPSAPVVTPPAAPTAPTY